MTDPFTQGISNLNDFQINVLDECLTKGSGGMSLDTGSGKTLISLVVALQQTKKLILVVCAKNLISSWELEIEKWFKKSLKYEVLHPDIQKKNMPHWKPQKKTRMVLTTPDVISKYYKENQISQYFIRYVIDPTDPFIMTKEYNKVIQPYLTHTMGGGYLFSIKWGCYIIDEAQNYNNINTARCQGLCAIAANYRWALSGTLFSEPKPERLLGYYIMMDIPNSPRSLPDMIHMLYDSDFKGFNTTIVFRKTNTAFIPPKVNEYIITHLLSDEEGMLYVSMKEIIRSIRKKVDELRRLGDNVGVRKFSSYILAMITYLRQSLVCPLIPISSVAIDMADYKVKSELSKVLADRIANMGIDTWLNDANSVLSTRISKVLEVINTHPNDRIVVFSCFRSCIDVIALYMPNDRQILSIKSSMNAKKRGLVIKEFENSNNGILLLTYELGAEGLNLQCSNTVLLVDFWWNSSKTKQAIARILRYGQMDVEVNIYYFTSNTGLEKAVFEKQKAKQAIMEELQYGAWKTSIPRISMNDILRLIETEENSLLLSNIISTQHDTIII
jgi:SNF2 family DNA or RNA helicase